MFIDTHTHLDHPKFDSTRKEVIEAAKAKEVNTFINAAITFDSNNTMRHKLDDYTDYTNIYYSVGIHPNYVGTDDAEDDIWQKELLSILSLNDRTVAIGETGFDYSRISRDEEGNPDEQGMKVIERQQEWFRKHIKLASIFEFPLILHIRSANEQAIRQNKGISDEVSLKYINAHEDAISILKEYQDDLRVKDKGIIHCFTSQDIKDALEYIAMGYSIGIGGAITFSELEGLREAVKNIPLEKIVLETDSPYVLPQELEGKLNSPANIPYIASKVAELKGISVEEVEAVTTKNAKRIFDI